MTTQKPTIISKETLVPVGFLIVLIGGAVWLTSLFGLASSNKEMIDDLRVDLAQVQSDNSKIFEQIAGINAKLDFLIEQSQ